MKKHCIFASLILASWVCCCANAAQEHYDSYAAFRAAHPALNNESDHQVPSFNGDLNEDRVPDKVVLLLLPDKVHSQIFVLFGDKRGGFDVAAKSDAFEYYPYRDWVNEIGKYVRNGFYVEFVARGGDSLSSYRYKFRLHQGVWRLAGAEFYVFGEGDDADEVQTISADFLSGRFSSSLSRDKPKIDKTRSGKLHFPVVRLSTFKGMDEYGVGDLWIDE